MEPGGIAALGEYPIAAGFDQQQSVVPRRPLSPVATGGWQSTARDWWSTASGLLVPAGPEGWI